MNTSRRLCGAFFSRFANRRVVFAIAAVSAFSAKLSHIYAHIAALPPKDVFRWGLSFFLQDVVLLLWLRILLDNQTFGRVRVLQIVAPTIAFLITLMVLMLASIDISFFVTAGSELSWRNAGLAGDSSAWSTLLSGLFSCSLVMAAILTVSWITQDLFFTIAGLAVDVLRWPVSFLASKLPCGTRARPNNRYSPVGQKDEEDLNGSKEDDDTSSEDSQPPSRPMMAMYLLVGIGLLALFLTSVLRPKETSLVFMSWTIPLLPFVEFSHSSPVLAGLLPVKGNGINWGWDNMTAVGEPLAWSWLPDSETPVPGFEDWYERKGHYNAELDPLKISNLEDDLLPELRNKLKDVDIRHVMVVKLESTRKDIFPFKKDSFFWDTLAETFEDKKMSDEALERLSTLTNTANYITGDYDDGFEHETQQRRGGINANFDFTTSTYTLKSMAGTFCGISGVVADFDEEVNNHIYQPCLAHIFDMFNLLNTTEDSGSGPDYGSHKWRSMFLQSVTRGYDKQDQLMEKMGWTEENTVSKEYLKSENATHPEEVVPDINYYGMPETVLEKYLEDAIDYAKENDERLFLSHLTSTSHHPFGLPDSETYVPVTGDKKREDLSHYVNAMGFVDRWLGRFLDILDEKQISNETLIVFVGDHGLSVPENNGITPYMAPNIGNFHVPLVVSHPQLPPINLNDPTVSIQILPTILDLLLETGSLSTSQGQAARDLVHNYEGQSLIRPMRKHSDKTGQPDWQITLMNPGRSNIAVRDVRNPSWRLVAPIVEDEEWRYSDLEKDPHEESPLRSFGFAAFLAKIEAEYSREASEWAEEAAFIARWWVEENAQRWRFSEEVAEQPW